MSTPLRSNLISTYAHTHTPRNALGASTCHVYYDTHVVLAVGSRRGCVKASQSDCRTWTHSAFRIAYRGFRIGVGMHCAHTHSGWTHQETRARARRLGSLWRVCCLPLQACSCSARAVSSWSRWPVRNNYAHQHTSFLHKHHLHIPHATQLHTSQVHTNTCLHRTHTTQRTLCKHSGYVQQQHTQIPHSKGCATTVAMHNSSTQHRRFLLDGWRRRGRCGWVYRCAVARWRRWFGSRGFRCQCYGDTSTHTHHTSPHHIITPIHHTSTRHHTHTPSHPHTITPTQHYINKSTPVHKHTITPTHQYTNTGSMCSGM